MSNQGNFAKRYIKEHPAAYREWLGSYASRLLRHRWKLLGALFLTAAFNSFRGGWHFFLPIIPAAIVVLMILIIETWIRKHLSIYRIIHAVDLLMFSAILFAALVIALASQTGLLSQNAPLMQAMIVASLFAYHDSFKKSLIRNSMFIVIAMATHILVPETHLGQISTQSQS